MKIQAHNAYSYIRHIKLLGYLSGKYEPDQLKGMAYCTEGEEILEKLLSIENKAHRLAEQECNGEVDESYSEKQSELFLKQVKELLPRLFPSAKKSPFFLNGDPRGYSLKCEPFAHLPTEHWVLHC